MHHTLQQLQEYVSELEQVVVHLATQEIFSGSVLKSTGFASVVLNIALMKAMLNW